MREEESREKKRAEKSEKTEARREKKRGKREGRYRARNLQEQQGDTSYTYDTRATIHTYTVREAIL